MQPRSAIISIFGGWLVFMDNWIAVADLVRLMEALDLEGPATRSAVGRLKTKGLLEAVARDGVAGYSATEELQSVLGQGEGRIFSGEVPANLADGWILAVFSVPETERAQRRQLRTQLNSLGFGPIGSGIFLAPHRVRAEAESLLIRNGLDGYVHLFKAEYLGFESITELARSAWDSAELGTRYRAFTRLNRQAIADAKASKTSNRGAFIACIRALEDWRPLLYQDPGLPDEILACATDRAEARSLFATIGSELKTQSDLFVRSNMRQFTNEEPS